MRAAAIVLACATLAAGGASAQGVERSGAQIVQAQCVKCHGAGLNGAPRIDDRTAWAPRMRQGLEATVRSAAKGHGAMPARGGMADLTDAELRAAIAYMFYPAASELKPSAPASAALADPHRKVQDGMEINLGIKPVDSRGVYHVSISLRDAASQAPIKDAAVEARVASPLGGTTKKLDAFVFDGIPSYLGDFRMAAREPYTITIRIRRPGAALPSEARFDFRP